MTAPPRHLVLVAGVGRSGTSLFASILSRAGFHVPQPVVGADRTNPKGFGEPQWVVDFHMRQLQQRQVLVWDSRPSAWAATARAADDPAAVRELRDWLSTQFDKGEHVVVKDPRVSWFLPLWERAAHEVGVTTAFATMLRHPAEAVSSAIKWYGEWQTPASRTTSWVNIMLETAHGTSSSPRVFVRYDSLLDDWSKEIARVGRTLRLPLLSDLSPGARRSVEALVDPSLHRSRVSWADLGVPEQAERMAEDVWKQFVLLATEDGDNAETAAALDESRRAYHKFYREAEEIVQSSFFAVRLEAGMSADAVGSSAGVGGALVRAGRRIIPRRARLWLPPRWRARIVRLATRSSAQSAGSPGR